MTTFISRDYNPSATGYINQPWGGSWTSGSTGRVFVSFMYELTLFLHKILGYSIVGETNWSINNTNIKSALVITAATNTSPITITTASAHGLIDGYTVNITGGTGNAGVNGTWKVSVTNSTQAVLIGTLGSGTYTASSATLSSGFQYASGLVSDGYGAGINFGASFFYEVSVPVFKRTVTASDIGRILVLKSTAFPTKNAGLFKISSINAGNVTTIAAASNGASLPQGTINVVSTTGFPASGTIFVVTSAGTQTVTYTGGGGGGTTFTGCSGGTGTMSTGGAVTNLNRYVIDYRSTETPPVEAANSINWWLYENETVASGYLARSQGQNFGVGASTNTTPIVVQADSNFPHTWITGQKVTISGHATNTNANGTWTITQATDSTRFSLNGSVGTAAAGSSGTVSLYGYMGGVTACPNSRIILQSPHAAGWQVRIAAEPGGANLPYVSISLGYGGTSTGDFPAGSLTTNVVEFADVNPVGANYTNTITGGGHISVISRMSIIGDDAGQSVFVYTRAVGAQNGILMFGIPENEPAPTPTNIQRLFCYGSANTADFGTIRLRTGTTTNVGMANNGGTPEFCALTSWGNLDGTSATNPTLSSNAGDSPFTNTTEILPIEIWRGITADVALTTSIIFPFGYNTRFMGTTLGLRNGRTNFGDFTISTDEVTTRTVTAATNASPIQITTSAANALTTGQTVTISGVTGNTAANGTWIITVINSTNFTLNSSTGNGAYISGGNVNGCARWLHLQNGIYLQWNGASGLTP